MSTLPFLITRRRSAALLALAILYGCAAPAPLPQAASSSASPAAPVDDDEGAEPADARGVGISAGPDFVELKIARGDAARALQAFRISCPSLVKREDVSGLARPEDWTIACGAVESWDIDRAADFFATQFELVQVGTGESFATGYFEPRIKGARTPSVAYAIPVYRLPDDLIEVDLGAFSESLKGRRIRGRVEGRKLILYHDRAAIEEGALAGRGLELAWASDPVDLFFLQIQGSGQLLLPDGSIMRIGYAGQNGRDYVAVGKLLKERGLVDSPVTMQAIAAWLRTHPDEGRAIMCENKSYIFFSELKGPGPLGALGLPVTPRATVAADPRFVPLGAPVVIVADRAEASGLWIAQDTGGAIKGANRFDTFWGAGDDAARIAGGMAARGRAYVLLPKGSRARIEQESRR